MTVLRRAMRDVEPEMMTLADLCRATGHSRGTLGPLWRGETKRMDPEIVNDVAKAIGVRVEVLLNAAGFDIRITPMRELSETFLADWALLPEPGKKLVRALAHEAATAFREAQQLAEPPPPTLRVAAEHPEPYDSGPPARTSRRSQP